MLELDSRAEHRGEIAYQRAEIDATLGGEIKRQFATVPLPLGVGQLHYEPVRLDALHRLATDIFVFSAELSLCKIFFGRRQSQRLSRWRRRATTMRTAATAHLGQFTSSVNVPEVFSAVGFNDHPRLERRCRLLLPLKEFFAIAPKGDFDEMRHECAIYSVNCPMRKNFSRRRRTNLSGFNLRSSSRFRMSASRNDAAAAS